MSPLTRVLVLILAIGGGMLYKKVNDLMGNVARPKMNLQRWWGDEAEPKDWNEYLKNSSEVIGNRLMYADMVS